MIPESGYCGTVSYRVCLRALQLPICRALASSRYWCSVPYCTPCNCTCSLSSDPESVMCTLVWRGNRTGSDLTPVRSASRQCQCQTECRQSTVRAVPRCFRFTNIILLAQLAGVGRPCKDYVECYEQCMCEVLHADHKPRTVL